MIRARDTETSTSLPHHTEIQPILEQLANVLIVTCNLQTFLSHTRAGSCQRWDLSLKSRTHRKCCFGRLVPKTHSMHHRWGSSINTAGTFLSSILAFLPSFYLSRYVLPVVRPTPNLPSRLVNQLHTHQFPDQPLTPPLSPSIVTHSHPTPPHPAEAASFSPLALQTLPS